MQICILLAAAVAEYTLPVYVPGYIYLGFALLNLAFLLPYLRRSDFRPRFAAPTLFVFGLLFVYSESWSSRKLFLHDLKSIRSGMSAQQVDNVMARHHVYNIGPPNTRLDDNGKLVLIDTGSASYRHSDDGEFNGDVGIVRFSGGRVTGVEFSRD